MGSPATTCKRRAVRSKWIDDDQAVVLHCPAVVGSTLVYATRSPNSPGASAVAINGVDGSRFWERAWACRWPRRRS